MKKSICIVTLFTVLFIHALNAMQPAGMPPQNFGAPNGAPNALPPMTEEDMLRWQQEVDAEIAKFVSTLPPEQQEQFHKDVEDLTKVMSNMSDEELTQFIEEIFVPEQEPAQPIQPIPQPVVVEERAPEKPAESDKDLEATNQAVKLLNNLITRIERFLRKAQMIPELPGKIERWVSKDAIKEWQADLTWATLKSKIETLDQKIHTIKETIDPKTKKFRHVVDLTKNESLYKTLSTLSSNLTTYEPKVEAPELGVGSVSKESRAAIKSILGAFAETIYTADVLTELDKLIALYEPQAKTHREAEERAKSVATESSKTPRRESPRREAIAPARIGGGYAPQAPDYYGGGYAAPAYSGSYAGNYGIDNSGYDYNAPAGAPYGGYAAPAGSRPGIAPDGKDASRGKRAGGEDEEELPGEQDGAPKKGGPKGKPAPEKEAFSEDATLSKHLKDISKNLEKAIDTLEDNDKFKNIEKFIQSDSDIDAAFVTDIQSVTRALRKSVDSIKAFNTQLNTVKPVQKEHYRKQIQPLVNAPNKTLTNLNTSISELLNRKSSLSATKRYAYFNESDQRNAALKATPDIDTRIQNKPADLEKLQTIIDDWRKAVVSYLKR